MSKYKHYSFDLWLTLIKSNSEFKLKRAEYFHKHFNRNNVSVEDVVKIIKDIDIMCNVSNEAVGKNIDAFEMYMMVLHRLGYDLSKITYRDLESIYHIIESIFFNYPPILYDDTTKKVLARLKNDGATLSILSNTGFIKGYTLRKLLDNLNISDLFSFKIFSDEIGLSKPNNQIYLVMINTINDLRKHNPVTLDQIIHIGDNDKSDYHGAIKSGIHSFVINSNDKAINDIQ